MAVVSFPFYLDCPVVEVQFQRINESGTVARRLLVDSGFTGQSAFVLPSADEALVVQRLAPETETTGALHGRHRRIWVACTMPLIGFRDTLLAICTDLTPLALPPLIEGMVGLRFLQRFQRWGGERRGDGRWHFLLETTLGPQAP